MIEERWLDLSGLRVSIFGSLRTQLFLPTSDIDVLVQYEGWNEVPVEVMQVSKKLVFFFLFCICDLYMLLMHADWG